ncbi:ATP-grasp domain-containing protein, partial [Paratractidigestivibacter sp.]
VTTGVHPAKLVDWTSKAAMKPCYRAAGIPVARQIRLTTLDAARAFAAEVGYPTFAKPEVGMGSGGAWKVENDDDLQRVFASKGGTPYVLEEFVGGRICSYDAIVDSHGEPLFENQEEFPPSMADVCAQQLDVSYYSCPGVDPKLRAYGRAAVKSFGYASRFVHMEFFRLTEDKPGLGQAGDYVGLEVNSRPPGGYTPEMMNYAHSLNVYQVWADMVCFDESHVVPGGEHYYCVHASRRDIHEYAHSREEVEARYAEPLMSIDRMPDGLADDLGNTAYVARFKTKPELDEFVAFVQERA